MRQRAARTPRIHRLPGIPLAVALGALLLATGPRVAWADGDDDTTVVKPDVDITPGSEVSSTGFSGREARPKSNIFFSIQLGGGVAQSEASYPDDNASVGTIPGFMGRLEFRTLAPAGAAYNRPTSCDDEGSNGCVEGGWLLDVHTVLETTMTTSIINPYFWAWEQTLFGGRNRWSDMQSGGFGAEIEYATIGAYFRDGTDLRYHIKTGQLTLFQGAIQDGFAVSDIFAFEFGLKGGASLGAGQYQNYEGGNAFMGLHEWVGAEIAARFPGILRLSISSYFRNIDATNFGPVTNGLMFLRNQVSIERPGDIPISIDGRMDENWRALPGSQGLIQWGGFVTYYYP